jgi:hypothetical protein
MKKNKPNKLPHYQVAQNPWSNRTQYTEINRSKKKNNGTCQPGTHSYQHIEMEDSRKHHTYIYLNTENSQQSDAWPQQPRKYDIRPKRMKINLRHTDSNLMKEDRKHIHEKHNSSSGFYNHNIN